MCEKCTAFQAPDTDKLFALVLSDDFHSRFESSVGEEATSYTLSQLYYEKSILSLQPRALDFDGIHVLVIDDNPHIVAGLSQVSAFWQCSVDAYDSADAVLAGVAEEHFKVPGVILCDYQLGQHWNGLELLDVLLHELGSSRPSVFIGALEPGISR